MYKGKQANVKLYRLKRIQIYISYLKKYIDISYIFIYTINEWRDIC